jgi:hypothetical protein
MCEKRDVLGDSRDVKDVYTSDFLEFSHPSYSGAFRYLREQDGHSTWVNDTIVYNLLTTLAVESGFDLSVVEDLRINFDQFPKLGMRVHVVTDDNGYWKIAV